MLLFRSGFDQWWNKTKVNSKFNVTASLLLIFPFRWNIKYRSHRTIGPLMCKDTDRWIRPHYVKLNRTQRGVSEYGMKCSSRLHTDTNTLMYCEEQIQYRKYLQRAITSFGNVFNNDLDILPLQHQILKLNCLASLKLELFLPSRRPTWDKLSFISKHLMILWNHRKRYGGNRTFKHCDVNF